MYKRELINMMLGENQSRLSSDTFRNRKVISLLSKQMKMTKQSSRGWMMPFQSLGKDSMRLRLTFEGTTVS